MSGRRAKVTDRRTSYNLMDFHGEISANHEAVFAHFP